MLLKRLSVLATMILAACVPSTGPGQNAPASQFNKTATRAEADAWRAAQNADTPAAYRAFIRSYPRSRYVPAATERISATAKKSPLSLRNVGAGRERGGGGASSSY